MTERTMRCAVCGDRTPEPTFNYRYLMLMLQWPNWRDEQAHSSCVAHLAWERETAAPKEE